MAEKNTEYNPVKQGPYKSYLRHDYQYHIKNRESSVEKNMLFDLGLNIAAVGLLSIQHSGKLSKTSMDELYLWNQVEDVSNSKFFIASGVPLVVQLVSLASKRFSLDLEFWKMINNVLLASFLVKLYHILRKVNVSVFVSAAITCMFSQVSLFQELVYTFNLDTYHLLALALLVLHWRELQGSKDFSIKWFINMSFVSLSLIFSTSGKFIGLVSWLWFFIISLKAFCTLVGDIEVSMFQLFVHFFVRFFFFVVLPFSTIYMSYCQLFNVFDVETPELALMSSSFQHYTMGLHENVPSAIRNGSTIRLRHVNSLGGYLAPLEVQYTDTNDSLVTISNNPNDEASYWIIELVRDISSKKLPSNYSLSNSDRLKLRNKKTGQLLRGSEDKPPVSDKEYDRRVSNTGDWGFSGDQDETWKLDILSAPTLRERLIPFKHRFMLYNPARRCSLLSHDVNMPNWANNDQEVLCVESAVIDRASFYIDFVADPNLEILDAETDTYRWSSSFPTYKLVLEYLQVQFKIDKGQAIHFEKESDEEGQNLSEHYLFFPLRFQESNRIGRLLWIGSTVAVGLYALIQTYLWMNWSIYEDNLLGKKSLELMREEVSFESFLGWFLHLFIFNFSLHKNFSVIQYLAAFFYAVNTLAQFLGI